MVKVVVAALNSDLAREVVDNLLASPGKHQVIGLTRQDPSKYPSRPGLEVKQTDYQNTAALARLLQGVEVVLSFTDPATESSRAAQRCLVDAAVEAGVRRFAPSEYSLGAELDNCLDIYPWYAGKVEMRKYLQKINENKKVIEYTLFQPGTFMEYLGYPKRTATHLSIFAMPFGLETGRFITMEGLDDKPAVTFTSVEDIARIVVGAVEYEGGEWPVVGGIRGDSLPLGKIRQIGETLKGGKPFRTDVLKKEDVEAGDFSKLDDIPQIAHPAIPKDQVEEFSKIGLRGILLAMSRGAFTLTDEWNQLLPDVKMTTVQEYAERLAKMD